jgi:RNA polymerase sigma-70 factor (ECF subfamily)
MLEALPDRRPSESSDAAVVVDHALARLPVNQAQILEAFYLEDRRTAQIAESMGVSERAVEGRLRRARQRLRRELEAVMRIAGGKR